MNEFRPPRALVVTGGLAIAGIPLAGGFFRWRP